MVAIERGECAQTDRGLCYSAQRDSLHSQDTGA